MSSHIDQLDSAVARRDGEIIMMMSPRQAKLLAATIWLADFGDAGHLTWLDTMAEMLSAAANGYGSIDRSSTNPIATLAEVGLHESEAERQAAKTVEAAAAQAAVIAEQAVFAAAEKAKAAAFAAQ